jgi:restriction system protein
MDILSLFPSNVIALWAVSFAFLAVLYWWKITARKRRHKRKQQQARRVLAKIQTLPAFGYKIAYLRKIDPFTFEELLLEGLSRMASELSETNAIPVTEALTAR